MVDLEMLGTQNLEHVVHVVTYDLQVFHLLSDPNLPPGKPKDAGTAVTGT